jgi:hypothetical protein
MRFECQAELCFELNGLRYGPYLEEGSTDARDERGKKKVVVRTDEGRLKWKVVVAATRKRKIEVKGMVKALGV